MEFLPQMEEQFKRLRVWEDIIPMIPAENSEEKILLRDASSGIMIFIIWRRPTHKLLKPRGL
jgi:hypothetical protein